MTQIKKYIKEHTYHITYIDHPRSKIYQRNLGVYDLFMGPDVVFLRISF